MASTSLAYGICILQVATFKHLLLESEIHDFVEDFDVDIVVLSDVNFMTEESNDSTMLYI